MEDITIKVDGKEYDVKVEETEDGKILVHCNNDVYEVEAPYNRKASIFNRVKKHDIEQEGKAVVSAPLPGIIFDIKVKKGDKVTLVGFGTFSVSKRAARTGRNPQTGETIKIKAKKVARFKAGKELSGKL